MRKVIMMSLAMALLGVATNVMAEEGPDGRGIRAGWQNTMLSIDDVKLDDSSNGFYVGYFNGNNFSPLFMWMSGIEYYQINGKDNTNQSLTDLKLHYLSVPLSLRLKLGPVYGFGGVNGAIKLGGDFTFQGEDLGTDDISTFDAGGHLGVGFKFLMLGVEARYNFGFVDIVDGADSKTEYLQIGAVLFF